MSVLVIGGAGYVGSVVVERLAKTGRKTVVLDNLSTGHREAVEPHVTFVEGDAANADLLEHLMREFRVQSVMHFCALSLVPESVERPLAYYDNNVRSGIGLLAAMKRCEVGMFIFSSSAAVFGEPAENPIADDAPSRPSSPYGHTKAMFEQILRDCSHAEKIRSVSLRYFNAAGATDKYGEDHSPESHLIPIVLDVAMGRREAVGVFGRDYPTPDGTCIRDYIHVSDLADAHVRALEALEKGGETTAYNLGIGHGFSVFDVIRAAEEIACRKIPMIDRPRRPGDPACLVASSERIREHLHWHPQVVDLRRIIDSAWKWKQAHPNGYAQKSKEHGESPDIAVS
ncbi:UDP-glucose 4-epimerase GalE [Candidatus Sumerlaeota bacterium]|nr:UDP-glucose 4-epimerase GalE [Candidatus Sumerlaeota bacterium]